MEDAQELQSSTLIIYQDFSSALSLLRCIIPYYAEDNLDLIVEIKSKAEQNETQEIVKLNHQLFHNNCIKQRTIRTKYYLARTNIWLVSYNHIIEQNTKLFAECLLKGKKLLIDSIFFLATAINEKEVLGYHQFKTIASDLLDIINPSIQTLAYQIQNGVELNVNEMSEELNLECFVESVFEDFHSIGQADKIVKPRATSIMDESEGISRIIDILEANSWEGQEMNQVKQKASVKDQNKLNIHVPTYNMNKDLREKYEQEISDESANHKEQKYSIEQTEKEQITPILNQEPLNSEEKKTISSSEKKNEGDQIVKDQSENKNEGNQNNIKEQDKKNEGEKKTVIQQDKKGGDKPKQKNDLKSKFQMEEDDEEQEESSLNDFIKIMQQMKNMRQNSSGLSDEQRKDQAAKFVLGLLDNLGIEESDDEK